MATLQQVSEGLSEVWDNLMEGWWKLYRRAGRALTRFTPSKGGGLTAADTQEISVRGAGWGVLACEVFNDDDRVVVRLEAPGMEKEDFDLQVINDHLVVRGEKQAVRERTEGGYHISECAYGSFERAIPLPDTVDTAKASARYRRGVLRVELPKSAPRRRQRITLDTPSN